MKCLCKERSRGCVRETHKEGWVVGRPIAGKR